MTPMEFIKSQNKNNESIYGEAAAEFISTAALHCGYMATIIDVINRSNSPAKDIATEIIVEIFAQNFSLLAHKLEIDNQQDYLSYLLLGRQMHARALDIVRESAH